MDKYKRFIEAYKCLENELGNIGWDFKRLEDKSDKKVMNQLRLCRNMRNYIQHVGDYKIFLEITDGMIEILEEEYKRLRYQRDVVGKHMVKLVKGTCVPDDLCRDVMRKMARMELNEIIVINNTKAKSVIRTVKLFDLIKAESYNAEAKVSSIKYTYQNFQIVTPDTLVEDVKCHVALCTSDGTVDGRLLGVFIKPY